MAELKNIDEIASALDDPNAVLDIEDASVIAAINKLSGEESESGDESEERTGPDEGEDGEAAAKAAAEEAAKKAVEEAAAKAAETKEAPVVLSKDGKHTMPFSVLEDARAREEAAIAAARQLADVVTALEAQLGSLKSGDGDGGKPQTSTLRDKFEAAKKEIDAQATEYPDMAPAAKAMFESMTAMGDQLFGAIERLERQNEQLVTAVGQTVQKEAATAKETAAEALAQVPALVVWRESKPDLFKQATAFDNFLKTDPQWAKQPMKARFEKAVEMVVAVRGASVLDGIAPVQTNTKEGKTEPVVDAKAKAQAAINKVLGLNSLSDLPAGTAVSQDPSSIEGLSDSQLVERIAGLKNNEDLFGFLAGAVGGPP